MSRDITERIGAPTPPRIELAGKRLIDVPLAVIAGMLTLALLIAFGTSAPRAEERPSGPSAPTIEPAQAPVQIPIIRSGGKGGEKGKDRDDDD